MCAPKLWSLDNGFDLPFHIFMPVHNVWGQANMVEVTAIFPRPTSQLCEFKPPNGDRWDTEDGDDGDDEEDVRCKFDHLAFTTIHTWSVKEFHLLM